MNPRFLRSGAIYLLIIGAVLVVFLVYSRDSYGSREIPITQVVEMTNRGEIQGIEIHGDKLNLTTTDGRRLTSRKEAGSSLVETLESAGVDASTGGVRIAVTVSYTHLTLPTKA